MELEISGLFTAVRCYITMALDSGLSTKNVKNRVWYKFHNHSGRVWL